MGETTKKPSQIWEWDDIQIQTLPSNTEMTIYVQSHQTPLNCVYLKWRQKTSSQIRKLGDHWERAYGDLEWRGTVPERVMPRYFLTHDGQYTHGYGVKTGAQSMCYWQMDTSGVSLYLDIRSGNQSVELGPEILEAATVITRRGQIEESAFSAARAFSSLMCPHAILPPRPVYGGNNGYYTSADA